MYWDEAINVTLLAQCERYIDVLVTDDEGTRPWRATFVYDEPRVENRPDMWECMHTLCSEWLGPWVVLGDFNEAMSISSRTHGLKDKCWTLERYLVTAISMIWASLAYLGHITITREGLETFVFVWIESWLIRNGWTYFWRRTCSI